jgi:hypothetical protein
MKPGNHSKELKNTNDEEKNLKEEEYVWNNNGGTGDMLSFSKNDNFIYIS